MTTTDGMAHDYDHHSAYQRQVAATGADRLDRAVDALSLADGDVPVLLDLGAATGANSMATMRRMVEALRDRHHVERVVCVHQDLPTNDWSALFSVVTTSAESYVHVEGVTATPMASAGSFFEPTTTPGLVDVAVSSSAAHWLRAVPAVEVDGMYPCEARGPARQALADAAAADWRAFMAARSAELRPGGHLVVQCVGTAVDPDGTEHVTARALLQAMDRVSRDMADAGALDAAAVAGYVFGVYPRTAAEARAPFDDGSCTLVLDEVSVDAVANPYLDRLQRDGDVAAYARDYVAFVRGFTDTALTDGLFAPSVTDRDTDGDPEEVAVEALRAEYYRRLEAAFAADPEGTAFRDWTLTVVAHRPTA